MTSFKEITIDQDTTIFLTFYERTIIAVGNVKDMLTEVQGEVDNYMEANNYDFVNLIYSNNIDVVNIEKGR